MSMTEEERGRALALLAELGIKLTPEGKMKKVASPRPHPKNHLPRGKVPAKPYNLRLIHECRLCGSIWNEDIKMVQADLDPSILVAASPDDDCDFEPNKTEKRFPRSCFFCPTKLAEIDKGRIIRAAMVLSNRVEDAEFVRHITKE